MKIPGYGFIRLKSTPWSISDNDFCGGVNYTEAAKEKRDENEIFLNLDAWTNVPDL